MELVWIGIAFALGVLATRIGQPPLVGYLVAGFVLEWFGLTSAKALQPLADTGILLLLFTIGLKLDPKSILRPEVWGAGALHMAATVLLIGGLCLGLGQLGIGVFAQLDLRTAALVGFALSFSSTVFAVKVLEGRGDMGAVYGRVAIGILVVQDLAAVVFVAASSGKVPSPWALALLLLFPLRKPIGRIIARCGHGELLVLGGVAAALGGAALFELVGLKGDLGALVAGALLARDRKAGELSKALLSLKDLFLVSFFLTVGLTGLPTASTALLGLALVPLVPIKGGLFYWLLTRFRLRARSSWLGAAGLSNFSEFGLIVGSVAVKLGWLSSDWLVAIAIAVATSFVAASVLNGRAFSLYEQLSERLRKWESEQRLPAERAVDASDAAVLIFGMGRVGTGAYDTFRERIGDEVIGFDLDEAVVTEHAEAGRRVLLASATDRDFWDRLHVERDRVRLVLLTMASHEENLEAIRILRRAEFPGFLAASARFPDEVEPLVRAGADSAFHVLAEAGAGFAQHVLEHEPRISELPT